MTEAQDKRKRNKLRKERKNIHKKKAIEGGKLHVTHALFRFFTVSSHPSSERVQKAVGILLPKSFPSTTVQARL